MAPTLKNADREPVEFGRWSRTCFPSRLAECPPSGCLHFTFEQPDVPEAGETKENVSRSWLATASFTLGCCRCYWPGDHVAAFRQKASALFCLPSVQLAASLAKASKAPPFEKASRNAPASPRARLWVCKRG